MSDPGSTLPDALGAQPRAAVRAASAEDAPAVAAAIEALLIELGGERPPTARLEDACRELAADREQGALLVAEASGTIVGVLAASWQFAIHVPGRYGTVQDLWVHPEWRSHAIGHDLIEALSWMGKEMGIARLEVGLPKEGFPRLGATEHFYRVNGFEHLGPRMRRLLS